MNWNNAYRTTGMTSCYGCGVDIQPNTLVRWRQGLGVFHIWCAPEDARDLYSLRDRPGRVTVMCPQP